LTPKYSELVRRPFVVRTSSVHGIRIVNRAVWIVLFRHALWYKRVT